MYLLTVWCILYLQKWTLIDVCVGHATTEYRNIQTTRNYTLKADICDNRNKKKTTVNSPCFHSFRHQHGNLATSLTFPVVHVSPKKRTYSWTVYLPPLNSHDMGTKTGSYRLKNNEEEEEEGTSFNISLYQIYSVNKLSITMSRMRKYF